MESKQLKTLKIQLIKALVNNDHARAAELEAEINNLEPGFVITDEDGKRYKMPPGWFEKYLKRRSLKNITNP